jgi:FAD/FMN-containing dehydrogenase
VGPAVSLLELRDAAVRSKQFYPPDPTEITASIGGTIATNASGSRSFKYGSTRRWVRMLRVAMMDGTVREFRRGEKIDFEREFGFAAPTLAVPNTTKYTAGYRLEPGMEWIDLFCGSEGTLGVTLEAEVALLPVPKDLFSGVIFFGSDEDALEAVAKWRAVNELRMMEYVDRRSLDMISGRYPEIPKEAQAALLIESEGDDVEAWDARLTEARALTEASWFALSAKDRERFREFRHTLPEVVVETMRRRGFMNMGTDYAVPIAKNGEMLKFYRGRLEEELPGSYIIFGHIGDAHVHVNMLPATKEEAEKATELLWEFAGHAVKLGGTVSAEHGLGKRKKKLLEVQYSQDEIDAMRRVKTRLDPQWLLGRGTLFGEKSDPHS